MVTLETDRLTLRMLRDSDLDAYAEMCADPEVMRYIGDGQPLARPMAWRNLAMMVGHWSLRDYGLWAVEEKPTGAFVGRIGFWNPEGWPGFELGWMLRRSVWGRGYATEGARAALQFAFTRLGQPHVISLIHPENTASIRVAHRLGERLVGSTEVMGKPALVFRITREEWEQPREESSVMIRPEQGGDAAAISKVHASAFPTDAEARLVDALRAAGHLSVSLVAEDRGRIVGHVAFSPVSLAEAAGGLGLAPLAVTPHRQREGIGGRLVREGLAVAAAAGARFVVLLGHPDYYPRFGFRRAAEVGLSNEYGADEAFMVLELRPGSLPAGGGLVRYGTEFAPWIRIAANTALNVKPT